MISSNTPSSYFRITRTDTQMLNYLMSEKKSRTPYVRPFSSVNKLKRPKTGQPMYKSRNQHVGSIYHNYLTEHPSKRPEYKKSDFVQNNNKSHPNIGLSKLFKYYNTNIPEKAKETSNETFEKPLSDRRETQNNKMMSRTRLNKNRAEIYAKAHEIYQNKMIDGSFASSFPFFSSAKITNENKSPDLYQKERYIRAKTPAIQ